jgi:hypothetical protein
MQKTIGAVESAGVVQRAMRRNDVVLVGKPDMWNFYGRINRILDEAHAEVICCGKHVRRMPMTDLTVDNEYKGYAHEGERFRRMPTLRRLKQMAARYSPEVWKRKRSEPTAYEAITAKWDRIPEPSAEE